MDRESLELDLAKANFYLEYLGEHQHRNFDVTGPSRDYLMPFFWGDSPEEKGFALPINHQRGLFIYYREIKRVLEKALATGHIDENELPPNAPDYLEELVQVQY